MTEHDPTESALWLAELRKAAEARDRAAATYARKTAIVRAMIRDAASAGVSMSSIARAAKINRTRAYKLKDKAER